MPLQIVRNDITKMKMDAIGGAIRHIGNVHKYARPYSVLERLANVGLIDKIIKTNRNLYGVKRDL